MPPATPKQTKVGFLRSVNKAFGKSLNLRQALKQPLLKYSKAEHKSGATTERFRHNTDDLSQAQHRWPFNLQDSAPVLRFYVIFQ